MYEKFNVYEAQLDRLAEALDGIMITMHILWNYEDSPLVDGGALASLLSLAHSTISETIDDIREGAQP